MISHIFVAMASRPDRHDPPESLAAGPAVTAVAPSPRSPRMRAGREREAVFGGASTGDGCDLIAPQNYGFTPIDRFAFGVFNVAPDSMGFALSLLHPIQPSL